MWIDTTNGNVGIGTTNPGDKLHVVGNLRFGGYGVGEKDGNIIQNQYDTTANPKGYMAMYNYADATTNRVMIGGGLTGKNAATEIKFFTGPTITTDPGTARMRIWGSGGVAIGDTYEASDPGTNNLTVEGNLTIGGQLNVSGADLAEEFSTDGYVEAGTVMVMDDGWYKSSRPCDSEYDTKAIGVVSDNASVIMGRIESENKAVIALTGVVKVKVVNNDNNGIIKKGDLLTTSSVVGHAMKATDPKIGTIIGKALEDFNGSQGEIMAFINLQ